MLAKWIYEGIIEDKFGEFMIMTEESLKTKNGTTGKKSS